MNIYMLRSQNFFFQTLALFLIIHYFLIFLILLIAIKQKISSFDYDSHRPSTAPEQSEPRHRK